MSNNMRQNEDGSWVPMEPIPEPWTWKWIGRIRRAFRRRSWLPGSD